MPWKWLVGLGLLWTVGAAGAAMDQERSVYMALAQDTPVEQSGQVLLTATFRLSGERVVLFNSDGNLWAGGAETLAGLAIYVDGQKVSSDAVMHWPAGTGLQHAFNALGVTRLAAGVHTATLVGEPLNGQAFTVGGHSNLAVFVSPSSEYRSAVLPYDTPIAWEETLLPKESPVKFERRMRATPLSVLVPPMRKPVIVMSSVRAYGRPGDMAVSLGVNDTLIRTGLGSSGVNRLGPQTQVQAPFFTHALIESKLTRDFSAYEENRLGLKVAIIPDQPFAAGALRYNFGAGSRLLALYGGMRVYGFQILGLEGDELQGFETMIRMRMGEDAKSAMTWNDAEFVIPQGHPGVVFFSAKARMHERYEVATGGWVAIRVVILDAAGKRVAAGSVGAQHFSPENASGQQTLASSLLSAGEQALLPGRYKARVEVSSWSAPGTPGFSELVAHADVPLIWFD